MEGKIFPDSANIWQDQAKVLFNYYRHAAERVVSEEERIENQVAALRQEEAQLNENSAKYGYGSSLLSFPTLSKRKNSPTNSSR